MAFGVPLSSSVHPSAITPLGQYTNPHGIGGRLSGVSAFTAFVRNNRGLSLLAFRGKVWVFSCVVSVFVGISNRG
jgi:hypothetical protein